MHEKITQNQSANLRWDNSVQPFCLRFNDPYFSIDNGLAETRHVFLDANGLPNRFKSGFQIAELGFGTGLNMFAALLTWQESGQNTRLHFTSFEAYPMQAGEMNKALSAFPELQTIAQPFLTQWAKGKHRIETKDLIADIIIGDARQTLPLWHGKADAWFLDGFSPAKNPELWDMALLKQVATHTAHHGTCATYTAAGFVRRGLADAGFDIRRAPGYGRKRHMTIGAMV